jgi:trans-aconitate 2-methyltransferase
MPEQNDSQQQHPDWDSALYLKFHDQRTRPCRELAARIQIASPQQVIDVGCGPGNSTRVLAQRWPKSQISAFDNSPGMLNTARASNQQVDWFLQDISSWQPSERYDVIFSNAALHWIPDHASLLPRLFSVLKPGGALAVQMPAHYDSPLHSILLQVAEQAQWHEATREARAGLALRPPSYYYDLLAPLTTTTDLWETKYFHEMRGTDEIIDWFRATGIRPFLAALAAPIEREQFLAQLHTQYRQAFPVRSNGKVLMPFRRFFFIGYRAD